MKVSIKKNHKSIHIIQDFELPDFVVLTGKNGSGKSHLMEAMTLPDRCLVFDDEGRKLSQIKYIPFNGLNPHVNELCEYLGLTNNRKQAWNNIKNYLQDFGNYRRNHNWSIEHYINSTEDRKRALGRWVKLSKGNVDDITEEFFSENYEISSEEMFSSQFASIFKLYGIKDFDAKNHSNSYVLVLGENQRYAIDNYVFDPIYVAFLLVRENILKTETLDLPALSYVQLSQLDDAGVQKMIDYVIKSLGFDTGNSVSYHVQSGKQYTATQEYFLYNGHELEDKIKDTWKPLCKIAQGGDNVLKNHVLDTVWTDYPEFISTDFIDLFVKIV